MSTTELLIVFSFRVVALVIDERVEVGPLAGMKPAEIRQILKDAGLGCVSSHFTFRELKSNLDDSIAWAKGVGLKYVICSSFGLPRDAKLDDWRSAAADLNVTGEKTRKAGL